ncbi:phospholipase D/nuclease [Trichoderma evansii]
MTRPENDFLELPDDADDDEALRYAIALSLQDQASTTPVVIDDSDDDDNDDDGSSTASPANSTQQTTQQTTQTQSQARSQPSSQQQSQFGSLFLDRKAMEQERLNRLAKRQRPATDDDDDEDVVEVPPPKKQAIRAPTDRNFKALGASTSASISASASATKTGQSSSNNNNNSSVPYPNPTVKRTWARGTTRTGDEITIEEVFQKDKLELAVLSSFQWDEEWMLSKLDYRRTKIMLLAFARDEAQKTLMRNNVPANIKFCFPPMHGVGAMHSKLQLLKYPNHLRIVIPTGNLMPYDWGETGVMENMVFLIDLPRLESPASPHASAARSHAPTRFYTELVYFLQATGVGEKMVASLANYDFSRTADIAFVHTIVADLGLAASDPVDVDLVALCVARSVEPTDGDDGIDEFKKQGSASSRSSARMPTEATKTTTTVTSQEQLLRERFRIYFPTDHTVSNSRGGRNAGGTICVQAKWWRSPTFPRELVRDVISRDRLLMHSKMIFVRRRVGDSQAVIRQSPGWAYVGSANLSESAWGRLSKDRSTGGIKLNCRNWECGVIIPVPESKSVDKTFTSADMSMFAGTVPVPMQVPGPVYKSSDQPWLYAGA